MKPESYRIASARDEDIVSRIGGDEFAVILPETGAEEAAKISIE